MKAFNSTIIVMMMMMMTFIAGCSKDSNKTVEELNNEAVKLLQINHIDQALETVTAALNKAETEYGAEHQKTAACLETMGLVYQAKGEPQKSESAYKRALSVVYKNNGKDSIESAKILNNLAGLFYSQKQYTSAANIYKQSLSIVEKKFSSDDPRLETLRKNIKTCEGLQNGKSPAQMTGKSDSQNNVQDLVPDQIKQSMLTQLAKQNIIITDLQPRPPVRIDNKGIVFPYHALKKSKDSDSAQEVVVLFASISNPEKPGAFIFQNCRLISYRSYLSAMKEGGVAQLRKELKEVFQGLYS